MFMPGSFRCQKTGLNPLKPEIWIVVSRFVGLGIKCGSSARRKGGREGKREEGKVK